MVVHIVFNLVFVLVRPMGREDALLPLEERVVVEMPVVRMEAEARETVRGWEELVHSVQGALKVAVLIRQKVGLLALMYMAPPMPPSVLQEEVEPLNLLVVAVVILAVAAVALLLMAVVVVAS